MGEKMTLEQVRDWHLKLAEEHKYFDGIRNAHAAAANTITAHLTQPAQAVDVERWSTDAIYEARGRGELTGDEMWTPTAALAKFTHQACIDGKVAEEPLACNRNCDCVGPCKMGEAQTRMQFEDEAG